MSTTLAIRYTCGCVESSPSWTVEHMDPTWEQTLQNLLPCPNSCWDTKAHKDRTCTRDAGMLESVLSKLERAKS